MISAKLGNAAILHFDDYETFTARDTAEMDDLRTKFGALSARQRQVMELAASGLSSKEIARQLEISAKTVENHRAWVMERIGARNLAELVRIAMKIERGP